MLSEDEEEEDEHESIRRSKRQPKLRFGTMKEDDLVSLAFDQAAAEAAQEQERREAEEQEREEREEEEERRNQRQARRAARNSRKDEEEEAREEEEKEEDFVLVESLREGLRPHKYRVQGQGQHRSHSPQGKRKSHRQSRPVERYEPPSPSVKQLATSKYKDDDEYSQYYASYARHPSSSSHHHGHHHRSSSSSRRSGHKRRLLSKGSTTEEEWSDFDEEFFQERKRRSMNKSRRQMQPLNLPAGADAVVLADRQRARQGASGADIEPMLINKTTNFEHIGGLDHHVRALKEMIVFPLLYPEVFERFKIDPPRGVLFHGPPGTGKTLCARALANECSKAGRQVSFFMRKGADCLSKWVGESERMLRLLFDQAYAMRPSIIFFDEIDGLAPVRTSRSDQNYNSIVSTLLALMDGLDSRGDVVIIGATNRIDNIDPALRRPGRFDREFLFPLPSKDARKEILRIHTKDWRPRLADDFIDEVAEQCVGYCGADMKALCTEVGLLALRRQYPQIYQSDTKLAIDINRVMPCIDDFREAMRAITPAAQRSATPPGRKLKGDMAALLGPALVDVEALVARIIPRAYRNRHKMVTTPEDLLEGSYASAAADAAIFAKGKGPATGASGGAAVATVASLAHNPHALPNVFRPRILLHGEGGMGQTTHIAPALLNELEKYPIHTLDLPALFAGAGYRTPDETCVQIFREACRTTPSVLYMPRIDLWWASTAETMKASFLCMLQTLDASVEMLLLATSDVPAASLPADLLSLFAPPGIVHEVGACSDDALRAFFSRVVSDVRVPPPVRRSAQDDGAGRSEGDESPSVRVTRSSKRRLEVIPSASASGLQRTLTDGEKSLLVKQEEATIRQLRMYLRDCIEALWHTKKFKDFRDPSGYEEAPDYLEIVKEPMDLEKMLEKLNLGMYLTTRDFLLDIDLICSNAYLYNPPSSSIGRRIRKFASDLKDHAHHLIENAESDHRDLIEQCNQIAESRRMRNHDSTTYAILPTKEAENSEATEDVVEAAGEAAEAMDGVVVANTIDPLLESESDSKDASPQKAGAADAHVMEVEEAMEGEDASSAPAAPAPTVEEDEEEEFFVPEEELAAWLDSVVSATQGSSVSELEAIILRCREAVYDQRHQPNKTLLVQKLNQVIQKDD